MIFDTHAHYDDEAFSEDRDALLTSMKSQGIGTIVNVGASLYSSQTTVSLTEQYDFIYGAVGVHPSDTKQLDCPTEEIKHIFGENGIEWLRRQLKQPKVVAVGEIGLDYHWPDPLPEIQKCWFMHQLVLAKEEQMPVIIHSREAAKDTLDLMKVVHAEEIGGVVHCFSYGVEMAREYLNMGFFIGVGGVVTFKNGKKLKDVVEFTPLDRIVLETDCPYLSPEPNRGKRNSSLNLPYVVNMIAQLKNLTCEEVIQATEENARRLYRIE